MTTRRRSATLILAAAATVIAVGFPAPSAQAAPNDRSLVCGQLIGMRDAYYDLYLRAKNDHGLLVVVAQYTWDATDAGCFGTEPALRQRALTPSS
jgi:hypothetical protein